MIVVIVNRNTKNFYPNIKKVNLLIKLCFNELKVPCQVLDSFTVEKKGMSAVSNIALQMNIKLGLPIWIAPKVNKIPAKTMVIGADVNHFGGIKSIVGFVASMDEKFS